ncbi:DUF2892 domain-containing protein [Terrimonas sp. NA20]|uniref:DUF2892 domain-containing protein n=1 Tax=Terrimonas ginsenosidimutans TaxID=2908004 RepID=A0ABS9KVF8_9BACT|nr:DUF2892 domain-containing protein [Terrimonas ginsenosidimutans]MCG2616308.1 DUF2892 domain-containing protein [Terrimonas ginsenosidimutans]
MKKNMGLADRIIRAIIAIGLILLCVTHVVNGLSFIVLMVVAAVFLLTSLVGVCPAYSLFGLNTCARKRTVH